MVKSLANFQPGAGLRDWLIQRLSAMIITAYIIFLTAFILSHPNLQFVTWQALFANAWMRIFNLLFLSSLLVHAWLGLWTVCTDYLKPTGLRLCVEGIIMLVLLGFFFWGIQIFWGVAS